MEENLTQKAIDAAINCDWCEAIRINKLIVDLDKEDIEALNRLAYAYFENGEAIKAKKISHEVLKIDPSNNIAKNSIEKFKKSKPSKRKSARFDVSSFIEEPGKTKLTTLINLGSEKVYNCLNAGDEVYLVTHAHKVSVITLNNKYVGKLADDLSARLRILIKAGKKYQVIVKSVSGNIVKIFIKGDSLSFPREASESVGEFSS